MIIKQVRATFIQEKSSVKVQNLHYFFEILVQLRINIARRPITNVARLTALNYIQTSERKIQVEQSHYEPTVLCESSPQTASRQERYLKFILRKNIDIISCEAHACHMMGEGNSLCKLSF